MKGGVVCFLLFVKLIFAQSYVIEWPFVEKKATYGVRIESKIDSRTLFFKFDGDPGYQYGDRVLIKGAIRACRKPRNLGMFDECKWWYRIGIDGQIDVDSHSLLSHSKKLPFLIFISNLPEQMFLRLQRNFASYAPFVYTVLFGNRIDYLET
ncbi:MAG: hypothetical protein VW397_03700, partial [Candidatus Margulisiibacteriota bacterium]